MFKNLAKIFKNSEIFLKSKNLVSGEFKRFAGYGVKSMWPIFKTKMLIFQSKASLDEKVLFGKITHHLDPEIRKVLVRIMFGNKDSTFQTVP